MLLVNNFGGNGMSIEEIIDNEAIQLLVSLKECPFCDSGIPNIFQVQDDRYTKGEFNWVIECKNMGCIFTRSGPDRSLKSLVKQWNIRSANF